MNGEVYHNDYIYNIKMQSQIASYTNVNNLTLLFHYIISFIKSTYIIYPLYIHNRVI